MNKTSKTALVIAGIVAFGVILYSLITRISNKSGNKEKDDRNIIIKRS